MADKLFLLDAMALIYRAHFALIKTPIYTSRGFNSSAIFGFTHTLLEVIEKRGATHLAVAFDTSAPTVRHQIFPQYKAQRDEMPEDLSASIPYVKRLLHAFQIPVLSLDGYEADDIIGTLTRIAEEQHPGLATYMVTPDKDFAQLVSAQTLILKPGRQGSEAEVLGVPEILAKWEIEDPSQVIDILGLWGDTSDNIPGVPGVGEKTAKKLIAQFGSVEGLLENTAQLKGKQREKIEANREQALLSKRLVTIDRQVPIEQIKLKLTADPLLSSAGALHLDTLSLRPRDEEALKDLFVQFEFNTLGKRLFGANFKEGRSHLKAIAPGEDPNLRQEKPALKSLAESDHQYHQIVTRAARRELITKLMSVPSFCFDLETSSLDPRVSRPVALSFCWEPGVAYYVPLTSSASGENSKTILQEFEPVFAQAGCEKVGHNLKFDLTALRWQEIKVAGPLFDTMLAHIMIEPEQRHTMDAIAETLLGYTPVSFTSLIGQKTREGGQLSLLDILDQKPDQVAEYSAEDADITWQIATKLRPLLREKKLETVFFEVEAPLIPVLVELEYQGFTIDTAALADFSVILGDVMERLTHQIEQDAGHPFNLNSPSQLGEILFDQLRLLEKPKKTKTGQYKTDEQTLRSLLGVHPIIAHILEYRQAAKLKSTYVDALPHAVLQRSGRVHTQIEQLMTATGRLASNNPNLQNIPIRTEMGREIRKAFIPRSEDYLIFAADYSQIELRVMASLSQDPAMKEAFQQGLDIHTATAARVYGVELHEVNPDMRAKAKMVNFGIIYGITGFGLAQRLGIPKTEATEIINQYLRQYQGVKTYMDRTIAEAKQHGYVETLTGRRRYLRDINSKSWAVRSAAERTAINTPVQGTAADMIKLAMIKVHNALATGGYRTRMLLQVHDELVFDLHQEERETVVPLVIEGMKSALPLSIPIVVDTGIGRNWLEAH